MKDVRRALAMVVRNSLNSDQINYIARMMDQNFDLGALSGFGNNIAIPKTAALETVLNYFDDEESQIRYFETMLNREGKFLFDAFVHIKGKREFIELLRKKRWIYDPDTQLFFRDQFYEEGMNFLRSVSFLDLRREENTAILTDKIKEQGEKLKNLDLEWMITLRMYGMTRDIDRLMRAVVEMLLQRQELTKFTYNVYFTMRELAVNAGKAGYKTLFEEFIKEKMDVGFNGGYQEVLRLFKEELEENSDERLMELAREKDKYFDLCFKSNQHSVSVWAVNYGKIMKVEKVRLLNKLNMNPFNKDSFEADEDGLAEGAGMGIVMVRNILQKMYFKKNPLKLVFYPDQTKIGYLLFRSDLFRLKSAEIAS